MSTASTDQLAVFGGERSVTLSPPHWPLYTDAEKQAVVDCMDRMGHDMAEVTSRGETVQRFERHLAESIGRKHAVTTSGGGPALHIACMAAGVQLGDEVICTPYTWGQSVSCVLQAGGVPIFADIDPNTLQMDPARIEPLITEQTKAIIPVDLYGIPCEMDAIMEIARRHNLLVIEDCAQAHGSRYWGNPVGSQAHLACFSIGSAKNLAVGGGGVIACDDDEIHQQVLVAGMHPSRSRREVTRDDVAPWVTSLIYTYRIHCFSSALGNAQLSRLEEMNHWRRENARRLMAAVRDFPGIEPLHLPTHLDPAWHMVPWTFTADQTPGVSRGQYVKALAAEGVPISGAYCSTPLHLAPVFRNKQWWLGKGYPWKANPRGEQIVYGEGDCPIAERRSAELDMIMGGGAWWKNCSDLIGQIAGAFAKVTAEPARLAEVGT
jgi:dTDP-4-amino-4,6-dideoxygalactose transaminase